MELQAAGVYRRTQAEREDQLLSWQRGDRAFFAAGACHILAWRSRPISPSSAAVTTTACPTSTTETRARALATTYVDSIHPGCPP